MIDFIRFLANFDLTFFLMILWGGGIGFALNDLRRAYICKTWPSIQGKIVLSKSDYRVFGRWERESPWTPPIVYLAKAKYIFSVDGIEYTGSRIFLRERYVSGNVSDISNVLNKYPNGKEVLVYYNRNNPRDCVLETKQPFQYFLWCYGTLGVCLFLLGMFVLNKS